MRSRSCRFNRGDESVPAHRRVGAPSWAPQEIRIRVRRRRLNRADRAATPSASIRAEGAPSPVLVSKCARRGGDRGVSAARGWNVGDRACACSPAAATRGRSSTRGVPPRVPPALSWEEAGGFPEVFLTAFLNIFLLGRPPAKGSVLVHGGGSGVGTAAISLCREAGLKVIVTAGSEEKCERCRAHGADVAINYKEGDFVPAVREATASPESTSCSIASAAATGFELEGAGSLAASSHRIDSGEPGPRSTGGALMRRLHVIGRRCARAAQRTKRASCRFSLVLRWERWRRAAEAGRRSRAAARARGRGAPPMQFELALRQDFLRVS